MIIYFLNVIALYEKRQLAKPVHIAIFKFFCVDDYF